MFAYHIESQIFSRLDIPSESLGARSRIESVRPPALVKRADLEEDFVVQRQPFDAVRIPLFGNLAHRRVSLNSVDDFSVSYQ